MITDDRYGISISTDVVPSRGNGDASPGLQAALDSGAPLIHVPYGIYMINKGLRISSNTFLRIHPEARMVMGDGAGRQVTDFLISNRNPDAGDANIAISGGVWDGNNRNNPRGKEGDPDAYTGTMINMKNVTGLELSDMRLQDSTAYFTRLTRVRSFRIENIRFRITHQTFNQDGIHCAGYCEDGEIHDIFAHGANTTGDDLVALNADDALLRSELRGAEAGHIKNIRISNLRAEDCHAFVRMASVWAEISDIDIRGVWGGCRNMALNADALRYCRVPLFDAGDPRYAHGVGLLRNIRIAQACVHKTGAGNRALFCLETRMDNFRLIDIRRDMARDTLPEAPFIALKNVKQGAVSAEYGRILKSAEGSNSRPRTLVAGSEDYVREDACGCIQEFELAQGEHVLEMRIDKPVLHDLPPANNMVGLKDNS